MSEEQEQQDKPDTRTQAEKKHDALKDLMNSRPTPVSEMTPFKGYHQEQRPIQKGKRQ